MVADTRYGKVGLAICYDRRYPETCRELMKKGARLILISISSSIMPGGFSELPVFETELKTRAFENQLFLAAGRSGQEEYTFFGHSMLLGPDGSVAQADEAENVVVLAEMELEDADRARINGPLLRDRRPELYTC
ncbi:MAG: carbon-nitrogen hydrolase family protein [Flavonifractor plautii]